LGAHKTIPQSRNQSIQTKKPQNRKLKHHNATRWNSRPLDAGDLIIKDHVMYINKQIESRCKNILTENSIPFSAQNENIAPLNTTTPNVFCFRRCYSKDNPSLLEDVLRDSKHHRRCGFYKE
jgi:hypothetical protein